MYSAEQVETLAQRIEDLVGAMERRGTSESKVEIHVNASGIGVMIAIIACVVAAAVTVLTLPMLSTQVASNRSSIETHEAYINKQQQINAQLRADLEEARRGK